MDPILVIGGAGYIGSHVCKILQESGWMPVVYDNLSSGHAWAVQFGPLIQADLEDEEKLVETFQKIKPKAVIHLASLINVRDSIVNPALYYEKNLFGSFCLLKAMIKQNIKKIIFSSTAAVYGKAKSFPIDETHPKEPLNAYGKSKWAVEGILEDFSHAYGIEFVSLRYFNACGASHSIGEAHEPETHLIPNVIRCAMEDESLEIYGDDFPTPDGFAIRDYIHVLDLASAHVQALQYLLKKKASIQLNLGTGRGFSVKQVVDEVENFSGKKIRTCVRTRLEHDSPILIANPLKAEQILGWKAQYSDLSTIVSTAWNWHQKRRENFAHHGSSDQSHNWGF